MKQITHFEKVMWGLYCEYSYIPQDVWYVKKTRWRREWDEEAKHYHSVNEGTYLEKKSKRSAKQWSFIHSKYHYITKVEPIYSGTLQDFNDYLEYVTTWGARTHRRSPYDYKKSGYGYSGRRRWWRGGEPNSIAKWGKKPPHIKKKTLSEEEIHKREWRKKVKDQRDQGSRFYGGGHKKRALRSGNRAERRYVKASLQSGDWSGSELEWWTKYPDDSYRDALVISDWDLYYDKGKRHWVDPWDWS